ncbi:sensor domain-containing protein [Mycobacterium avium]|uniref:sensor domain-containing protein n=1 Tax=Mycobacterium avium TaxID=1764 RepID=UPI00032A1F82|nr:sensor domain-containing protein [Mycobacterium avium]AGL37523.1 lipoprotein LpqQ [Mycobacterium avium subsp. paratuberculosis MAP4]MBD3685460.1 sensor domain-containing protein [Mycobacterium avium subsp. paratuberculosis]MBD3691463.1 sensor domain-containing protein [Mycobacterium avium subsp. paratuberculosis]MCF6675428.1 sensor domain-containing protein [Mycobacterium avium subsp. paratuberculosis]UKO58082.1 sensor domain-containing protein [Mycobacterium avium subsp. paratuberculosis]
MAILVVASLLPGCGRTDTPTTKETTTTSGKSVETLLVNLDDVRRIADTESLNSGPGSQVQQPRHSDSNTPTPCRAVFDQEAIFDGDWTQFRSATYNGDVYSGTGQVKVRGIANVVQAVGIYRDADTARAHFDQLLPSLTACTALHAKNYDFTVRQLDTDTLSLSSSVWKLFYRVKSSVLLYVGALGVPQTEQSAQQILQTITNRVT